MDRVLVTGASGFVGSAVMRRLAARGYRLRALMRPTSPRDNVANIDCEIAIGDMRDAASLKVAMKDIRYLFHVAADYRIWARDPKDIIRNNRDGTRNIMVAARDASVERIVYTSSVATLKPRPGTDANENDRATLQTAVGFYKKSKVAAEHVVDEMAVRGLPVVIVSPSTPIGPRDVKPTPTGRIIVEAASGRMPGYVDTGLNLVHVDDVAEGHALALEKGRLGQNYILGGQNATLYEMLFAIAQRTGRKAPRFRIPRGSLYPLAYAAEAVARVTGREPFVTIDALNMSKHHMFFSSAKAEQELGFHARPYGTAIDDALTWFQQAGYLG